MLHRLSINGYPTPDRVEPVEPGTGGLAGSHVPSPPPSQSLQTQHPNTFRLSDPVCGVQWGRVMEELHCTAEESPGWRSWTTFAPRPLPPDPVTPTPDNLTPSLSVGPAFSRCSHLGPRAAPGRTTTEARQDPALGPGQGSVARGGPWGSPRLLHLPEEDLELPHPTTLLAISCPDTFTPSFKEETNTPHPA